MTTPAYLAFSAGGCEGMPVPAETGPSFGRGTGFFGISTELLAPQPNAPNRVPQPKQATSSNALIVISRPPFMLSRSY